MKIALSDITAVILAGGQGRRMGGFDKGWIELDGKPIIQGLIEQLENQKLAIAINANRNLERYTELGYPVISDTLADYQGPLAGFASVMRVVTSPYILTLPCDGPAIANDYAKRFIDGQAQHQAPVCVAHDGQRLQPVHALIRVDLRPDLEAFLASGDRKIDRWYACHDHSLIDFSDCRDMFRNINTPEDRSHWGEGA